MKSTLRGKWWLAMLVILAFGLLFAAPASAGSGTVTVNLLNSSSSGLVGGNVYYYQSGWQALGTTDGTGKVTGTVPITTDVEIRYAGGSYKWVNVDPATNPTLTINTVLVTVKLETCGGTPLVGQAKYSFNGEAVIGATPATIELLPYSGFGPGQGNYDFRMTYEGRTSPWKTQDISFDPVVVFKTTKVDFHTTAGVSWYNGGWTAFTSPKEVLGGTSNRYVDIAWADFKFENLPMVTLNITGCSIDESIALLRLIDSNGKGLAGGTAQYYDGGWKSIPGSSDANGWLLCEMPGVKSNMTFRMSYAGASLQKTQNIALDSFVVFQTKNVVVQLKNSLGAFIDTGTALGYYTGTWNVFAGGNTSSGQASMELLPGNYCFRMTYLNGYNQKWQDVGANSTVVFQTKNVVVQLKNSLDAFIDTGTALGYYTGTWNVFAGGNTSSGQASMELLPGNYCFRMTFAGTYQQKWQDVGANSTVVFQTKNVVVQLKNSLDAFIDTGTALGYYTGTWNVFAGGNTSSGQASMELLPGNYCFRMTYLNGYNQKWQDVGANSTVVFQTVPVVVQLKNSLDAFIDTGTALGYYTGTWNVFAGGNTSSGQASMELLPGNYCFRMTYLNGYNQKWQDVGINSTVVFQTKAVTIELRDSGGNLVADPSTQGSGLGYYTGTWNNFDPTSTSGGQATMQLLPGNYCFRTTFAGIYQQKWQDVSANPIVVFGTVKVTLQYSGSIQYYTGGTWRDFAKPSMGLFPGTYPFKFDGYQTNLTIPGTDVTKSIVVARLLNSGGGGIAGGTTRWYDSSWRSVSGTTGSNGALVYAIDGLKGNMAFDMTYASTSNQIWQDISLNSIVLFQTVKACIQLKNSAGVLMDGGTGLGYYTGTWNTFGSGATSGGKASMELLPGNYAFHLTYGNAANQISQDIKVNPTIVFQTTNVKVQLKDSAGGALDTGSNVGYYTGVWNTLGSGSTSGGAVSAEMLPGNYAFHLTYAYAQNQISQVVSGPSATVLFQTKAVTVKLIDDLGQPLTGATGVSYYVGTFYTLGTGTADANGEVTAQLLPGNYAFLLNYAYGSNQKWQDVTGSPTVVFQTGEVHSTSGTCTQYWTGAWHPFSNDMQLLPNTYAFTWNDGTPQTYVAITAGMVNSIH